MNSVTWIMLAVLVVVANCEAPQPWPQWECPCSTGGFCASYGNDECNCFEGWTGDLCEEPTECMTGCANGNCDRLGMCNCYHGWKGEFCDIEDPFDCFDCQNGHCDSTLAACVCMYGWAGENCDVSEPLVTEASFVAIKAALAAKLAEEEMLTLQRLNSLPCDPVCNINSYCVGNNTCKCHNGWTGDDCTVVEDCTANCDKGWCDTLDTCHCNLGYEGEWCDELMIDECLTSCVNGWCSPKGECACRYLWEGEWCDVPYELNAENQPAEAEDADDADDADEAAVEL